MVTTTFVCGHQTQMCHSSSSDLKKCLLELSPAQTKTTDTAMLSELIRRYRLWNHRRTYRAGSVISRFVACDIRRDIEVVDTSEMDNGFITVAIRTWNVLYASKGITPKPEFGEPVRMPIGKLWQWDSPAWGGPVPDENEEA